MAKVSAFHSLEAQLSSYMGTWSPDLNISNCTNCSVAQGSRILLSRSVQTFELCPLFVLLAVSPFPVFNRHIGLLSVTWLGLAPSCYRAFAHADPQPEMPLSLKIPFTHPYLYRCQFFREVTQFPKADEMICLYTLYKTNIHFFLCLIMYWTHGHLAQHFILNTKHSETNVSR